MKKNQLLLIRFQEFKIKLEQFKSGKLSEEEFEHLLLSEIEYLKRNVILIYQEALEKDKQQINILKRIKHKINNNIQLSTEEKNIVLSIIS